MYMEISVCGYRGNVIEMSTFTAMVRGQEWAAQFNREKTKLESHGHKLVSTGDIGVPASGKSLVYSQALQSIWLTTE